MSSGDLPFAVHSGSLSSNQRIANITITDVSPITVARNILFAKIISDLTFDPNNEEDLQDLWNIWYNMKWSSKTRDRFLRHVTELNTGKLPQNLKLPAENDTTVLENIWGFWISLTSDSNTASMQQICDQRYIFKFNCCTIKYYACKF